MKKTISIILSIVFVFSLVSCSGEKSKSISGIVKEITKHGHASLDLDGEALKEKGIEIGDIVTVSVADFSKDMPFFDNFYVKDGELVLWLRDDHVEICINYGAFCETYNVKVGDNVTISLKEKDGVDKIQSVFTSTYSNAREDFSDDVTFANAREVVMGKIASGKLYRSCSPINNEHGRASVSDSLAKQNKIGAVLNLADTEEDIKKHISAQDFYSLYYKGLYESKNVISAPLGNDFHSTEYVTVLVKGLTELAQKDGPYLIHCTEGKDRAGFAIALLEALMGADVNAIAEDYMISYQNYFGINPTDHAEAWDIILEGSLYEILRTIAEIGDDTSLDEIDLAKSAESFLLNNGMEQTTIDLLKSKLSDGK